MDKELVKTLINNGTLWLFLANCISSNTLTSKEECDKAESCLLKIKDALKELNSDKEYKDKVKECLELVRKEKLNL